MAESTSLVYADATPLYDGPQEETNYTPNIFCLSNNLASGYSEDPEMAVSLTDILSDTSIVARTPDITSVDYETRLEDFEPIYVAKIKSLPSTCTDATVAVGKLSAKQPTDAQLRTKRLQKHHCAECGGFFDRASRARDHAFRDLGQTPYACESRCENSNW